MAEEPKKDPKEEAPAEEQPAAPAAKSTPMIDAANEAAERLEKANKKNEELISKQEALAVEKTFGGEAEAGAPAKEETPEEYAKKVMANDVETK